jgi:hypothetical protein
LSAKSNGSIGEKFYIPDSIIGIWIEGSIKSSIRIETCHPISCRSNDIGKSSSDKDLIVGFESKRVNDVIGVRIKGSIKSSIGIETGNKDFSIRLDEDSPDLIVWIGIPSEI